MSESEENKFGDNTELRVVTPNIALKSRKLSEIPISDQHISPKKNKDFRAQNITSDHKCKSEDF